MSNNINYYLQVLLPKILCVPVFKYPTLLTSDHVMYHMCDYEEMVHQGKTLYVTPFPCFFLGACVPRLCFFLLPAGECSSPAASNIMSYKRLCSDGVISTAVMPHLQIGTGKRTHL